MTGAAAGTGSPQRAAKAASPSAFKEAVLPPVLGPAIGGNREGGQRLQMFMMPLHRTITSQEASSLLRSSLPRTCDDHCSRLRPHCHVNRLRVRRQLPGSSCLRCAVLRSPAGEVGGGAPRLPLHLLSRKQVVAQQQGMPAMGGGPQQGRCD